MCSETWSTNVGTAMGAPETFGKGRRAPRKVGRPSSKELLGERQSLTRDDVDDLAAALAAELHRTGLECEQGVVAAAADAAARVEVRAALADDDLARVDELAAEALHAEALGVGVAAVLGGRGALLVCHFVILRVGAQEVRGLRA